MATAFKLSLKWTTPIGLVLIASAVSTLVFVVLVGRGSGSAPSREQVWRSAWLGFLNPCLYYVLLFVAYDRLTAQEAQCLNFVWPLALTLVAGLLRRKMPGVPVLLGLMLSFCGVVVVATRGAVTTLNFSDSLGVTAALASALVWAVYWVVTAEDPLPAEERLRLNFLFGTGWTLLIALVTGSLVFRDGAPALIGGAYVGLFEMGFTFLLWLKALRLASDPGKVSSLAYLTPVLSLCWIGAVLGERLMPSTLVGLALILAGIGLGQWKVGGKAHLEGEPADREKSVVG